MCNKRSLIALSLMLGAYPSLLSCGGGGVNSPILEVAVSMLTLNGAPVFSPKTVTVSPGGTVRFTNLDSTAHSATGDTQGGPDSDSAFANGMASGDIYNYVVSPNQASGTAIYFHCRFHGAAGNGSTFGTGMVGSITVK